MKKTNLIIIIMMALSGFSITASAEEEANINIDLASLKIEMPEQKIAAATATTEQKPEPIPFPGGTMIGNVKKENAAGKQTTKISGTAVFLLGNNNPGGILTLTFADPQALKSAPVSATLREFPEELNPAAVKFDGRPVEIEIAPGKIYISLNLIENEEIRLSKAEFTEKAKLSDVAVFKGIQIKLTPSANPNLKGLQNYLKITK